jgi:isocitrate dehydrogenase kinase/phosphatase
VVITHLYTERRVTPLNLYVQESDETRAREALLDYGRAIKELAAANIFTGDMLRKNFGVTRHRRVIFYDYDELCLLTDCNFRDLPEPHDDSEEMSAEPWFHVGEADVFPEEFRPFLTPPPPHRDAFLSAHGELLDPEWWREGQRRARSGELPDFYPYGDERRVR